MDKVLHRVIVPTMRHKIERYQRAIKGLVVSVLLRFKGVKVADRVVIEGRSPFIVPDGDLYLGSRISFRSLYGTIRIIIRGGARLSIGARCFINNGCSIESFSDVEIGDHCLIGDSVQIMDNNYHQISEGSLPRVARVRIGRNVWLANRCLILAGVEIGDHSVVGAGAVVTKSFPPRSIIGGNPARLIGQVQCSDDWIRR
ncbi:2,3,4,5-tetrahydropyridine-2,6-dicarboxylate N-acetyltransferase [Novosphingobium sp. CECT 9465]|nr:2,3,4,5-tetrahydropyridine-2,6-dicarboxylate N-acetyltransferase [Novosphingobium sp. CECT 9465]